MNFYEKKLYEKFNEHFVVTLKADYISVKYEIRWSYPEIRIYKNKTVKLSCGPECGGQSNYASIRNVIIEMKSLIDMYPDEYEAFMHPDLATRISEKIDKNVSVKCNKAGVFVKGPDIDLRVIDNTVLGKYKTKDKHAVLKALDDMGFFTNPKCIEDMEDLECRIYRIGDIILDGKYKKVIVGENDMTYEVVVLYDGFAVCYNKWPRDTIERFENNCSYIGHYDDVEKLKQGMADMILKGTPPLKVL